MIEDDTVEREVEREDDGPDPFLTGANNAPTYQKESEPS